MASTQINVIEKLNQLADAFQSKDMDRILACFTDDCVFYWPRGPHPRGRRLDGKEELRDALLARYDAIPDSRYSDYEHFASEKHGISRWHLIGTTTQGTPVDVWGMDISTFNGDGLISEKDAYWKITLDGGDGEYDWPIHP